MYGANRIPLERKSLWDFPTIRFHFEYKCRFLFIANIHSIISKSLACGCMMRMREPDFFFFFFSKFRLTVKAAERRGKN